MLRLTILTGEGTGTAFELRDGEHIAGRSHTADLRLGAADVSGKHLRITVAAGAATAENLSRNGTMLDDAPLAAPTVLKPGQKLRIGAMTVLLVEDVQAPAAVSAVEVTVGEAAVTGAAPAPSRTPDRPPAAVPAAAKTGVGPAMEKTGAGKPAPAAFAPPAPAAKAPPPYAAPAPAAAADTGVPEKTVAGRPSDTSPEGGTRIMQTRVASQEEIGFLREAEHKRAKQRLTLIVGGIGLALILALLLWPRHLPPEPSVTWPKDAQGNYLDAFVPAPGGGYADGGYDLAFPGEPGKWKCESVAGGLSVKTVVGRDRDVPLRLILEERTDPREGEISRETALEEWVQQMRESGGRWNFDPPSAVFFIGRDNGIPAVSVSYQREGETPVFGVATLFRHGLRRVVLRAEVPAAERVRAEAIVNTLFLNVSQDFVIKYWEGTPEAPKGEPADLIRQARLELEHVAPATWVQIESMIINALRKAVKNGNREQEDEAMKLLLRLRDSQATWFNSQRIAYFKAMAQNNPRQAARIAEFCKAVFSSQNDQRYYAVRKNDW